MGLTFVLCLTDQARPVQGHVAHQNMMQTCKLSPQVTWVAHLTRGVSGSAEDVTALATLNVEAPREDFRYHLFGVRGREVSVVQKPGQAGNELVPLLGAVDSPRTGENVAEVVSEVDIVNGSRRNVAAPLLPLNLSHHLQEGDVCSVSDRASQLKRLLGSFTADGDGVGQHRQQVFRAQRLSLTQPATAERGDDSIRSKSVLEDPPNHLTSFGHAVLNNQRRLFFALLRRSALFGLILRSIDRVHLSTRCSIVSFNFSKKSAVCVDVDSLLNLAQGFIGGRRFPLSSGSRDALLFRFLSRICDSCFHRRIQIRHAFGRPAESHAFDVLDEVLKLVQHIA